MSNRKNLEALRAKAAFDFAKAGEEKSSNNTDFNYPAAVQELASIIRMNGFRAAMAYFYSKGKAHGLVFEQVRQWFKTEPTEILKSKFPANESSNEPEQAKTFMKILLDLDDDKYRIAQAEIRILATWMIRFAKAPDTTNSNNNQLANANDTQP